MKLVQCLPITEKQTGTLKKAKQEAACINFTMLLVLQADNRLLEVIDLRVTAAKGVADVTKPGDAYQWFLTASAAPAQLLVVV